jgi:hypothetical protein
VPDGAVNHRQPRSLTDKSLRRSPALIELTVRVVAASQADGTASLLPPAGPRAQGWTGKCKSCHCQCLAEVGTHPLAIGQTGLADLAPRAKVGQTVGCSTFTRGAKPATRRAADGERMNPPGTVAPTRQCGRRRAPGRRAPRERRFQSGSKCLHMPNGWMDSDGSGHG